MKKDMTMLKAIIQSDYKRHVKKFEKLEAYKPCILLGDSMMAYFPVKAFHLENQVHNLGIPGDTSIGVLNRVQQVIKLKPKFVVLNIGLNDFVLTDLSQEESLENILEIRHQILEGCPDAKVFVMSLTPINQEDYKDQVYLLNRDPKDAVSLNNKLKEVINEKYFINVYDKLSDDNHKLKLSYTRDGIHLNQKGYKIYDDIIKYIFEENAHV